ncbi:MAG: hypothetical protein HY747_09495 [Elusimicrobia bacterium]|nr:hypothetical protein [Elusimicrobiota bacterium]
MTYAFSFLGFGAWGATLAIHLARHGAADITAWEHFDQLRDHIRQNNWHPSLGENAQIPETIKIADRIADLPRF